MLNALWKVLRSLAGKPILNGRDSVRQVLESMRLKGGRLADVSNSYHGLVIENFDCDKSIYTAVEVTAGNRMFHHIVESDRVGTEILKIMNQEKLPGEVTSSIIHSTVIQLLSTFNQIQTDSVHFWGFFRICAIFTGDFWGFYEGFQRIFWFFMIFRDFTRDF